MSHPSRFVAAVLGLCACMCHTLAAQLTVPERTNYARTSTHAEVLAFIDSLAKHGAVMHVGTLGTSPQGRHLPYVILSRPLVTTPAAAKATGKPILYIQANIHAGEVEGKEAMQVLARDLTLGKLKPLLDSIVLIWVPIYNADGNDAFGPQERNRGSQVGPEMVGLRANGQGYDLNRDYIKQEAPETRASIALIAAWDPDLFMDLHTTDGAFHGYALTWDPGLNPNHTPTNDWVRDTVLEAVRKMVRSRDHFETYSYGEAFDGGTANPTGWRTYESLPRYGTNLNGMTRVSVLSEAMSHDTFPRRIAATYAFVLETIRYLNDHKLDMRRREAPHRALPARFGGGARQLAGERAGADGHGARGDHEDRRHPGLGAGRFCRDGERAADTRDQGHGGDMRRGRRWRPRWARRWWRSRRGRGTWGCGCCERRRSWWRPGRRRRRARNHAHRADRRDASGLHRGARPVQRGQERSDAGGVHPRSVVDRCGPSAAHAGNPGRTDVRSVGRSDGALRHRLRCSAALL